MLAALRTFNMIEALFVRIVAINKEKFSEEEIKFLKEFLKSQKENAIVKSGNLELDYSTYMRLKN